MKMICSILLLLSLTSCVSGAFVVNVTQTYYQAEENHNITLEWMFTTRTNSSPNALFIYCQLSTYLKASVLFHLYEGVEAPESQDKQFAGRVRWDKDVLRDGRIRLHMSRLRINDSGVYQCDMQTDDGRSSEICCLKVTAAADEPTPPTPRMRLPRAIQGMGPPPAIHRMRQHQAILRMRQQQAIFGMRQHQAILRMRPQPERPGMGPLPEFRVLYVGLGLAGLLFICVAFYFTYLLKFNCKPMCPCDLLEVTPLEERGQREEMIVVSSMCAKTENVTE